MKKALQGFWRGGLLGGGLLGALVFTIALILIVDIRVLIEEGFSDYYFDFGFFAFMQLFSALPGMLFGFVLEQFWGYCQLFY